MIDHGLPALKLGDRSGQLIQPIYPVDNNLLLYVVYRILRTSQHLVEPLDLTLRTSQHLVEPLDLTLRTSQHSLISLKFIMD